MNFFLVGKNFFWSKIFFFPFFFFGFFKFQNSKVKVNKAGQTIIQDHLPSAVAAHAALCHGGKFNFSYGLISVQRQEDARKAYEALVCKEIDPSMNRRLEGGGVIPI